uniref:Cytochrome P450 n=1 Tax=Oryza brachyantha TaxID=4533 RepID=J3N2H1_ORYBR
MAAASSCADATWWAYALPALLGADTLCAHPALLAAALLLAFSTAAAAALNNIMGSVFGRRYDVSSTARAAEAEQLKSMVREGFELLGAFNWSDHLPWLPHLYEPNNVARRCAALVPRVQAFVRGVIRDHRLRRESAATAEDNADFVDVLLSLEGDEKLGEDDMVAVLWVKRINFSALLLLYSQRS